MSDSNTADSILYLKRCVFRIMIRFLPYDEETARAITREGKRMVRKLLRELNIKYREPVER